MQSRSRHNLPFHGYIAITLVLILYVANGSQIPASWNPDSINQYKRQHTIDSFIESFRSDLREIDSLPLSNLTSPCTTSRDISSTYLWTVKDWEESSSNSLARYVRHYRCILTSTTARSILPTVLVSAIWSLFISLLYHQPWWQRIRNTNDSSSRIAHALTFFQAPLLLLLALRANRALDRLLQARRAWAALTRSVRNLAGLFSFYILPDRPELALLMARYLAIMGWSLKGLLRDEDDMDLIGAVLGRRYRTELDWIIQEKAAGVKRPTVLMCRMRALLAMAVNGGEGGGGGEGEGTVPARALPPVYGVMMEEVLQDLSLSVGTCMRLLMSPTPPVYTTHTSRMMGMYLAILPCALLSIGAPTLTIVFTSVLATYVLVGIDEIGCFIEHPFPIIPLSSMAKIAQNEVERQIVMAHRMPKLK